MQTPLEREQVWKSEPCIAKLTYFGESWGRISDTARAARSQTVRIYKGTPAFMAPEVISPNLRPFNMDGEQLRKADVWSLSMVFFV